VLSNSQARFRKLFLAAAIVLALAFTPAAFPAVPALAAPYLDEIPARLPAGSLTLQEFASQLTVAPDGKPAGIYVAGTIALPIVQQPANAISHGRRIRHHRVVGP
jgi:hypothetical protein